MNSEFAINFPDPVSKPSLQVDELKSVSKALEATFLTEMLKHSGINKTSEEFGGGAGEEAFASMLNQELAKSLSDRGGIGLAEHIFRSIAGPEVPYD